MTRKTTLRICLIPALLALGAGAQTQDDDINDVPDIVEESVSDDNRADADDVSTDAANNGTDAQDVADPLAELEEPEMDATIDRFDPSEKISEDRSVSFPNDI